MASSTVKHIQVAMSANTEAFDAGMIKASSSLKAMDRTADQTAKQMGKLATQFQQGLITKQQYTAGLKAAEAELNALQAGFNGMSGAVQRAAAIIETAESATQRYARSMQELTSLKKLNLLTEQQYRNALADTERALNNVNSASRRRSAVAGAAGGRGMAAGLGRFAATRMGIPVEAGLAVGAVAAAAIASVKFVKAFGAVEEMATKAGIAIDAQLVAASKRFNDQMAKMPSAWATFIVGMENLAAPVTGVFGGMISGIGGVIRAMGNAADATAKWLKSFDALAQFWGPAGIQKKIEAATTKSPAQKWAEEQEKWSRDSAKKGLEWDAEKTKAFEENFAKMIASWNDKVTSFEEKFKAAVSPAEQLRIDMNEINAAYERGLIPLEKRNEWLNKTATAARALGDAERKAEATRLAGIAKLRADTAKKRLGDMTSRAQSQLDAMLSGGRQRQISPAALEAGSGAAFSAFNQARLQQSESKNLLDVQRRALQFIQEMARRGIVLSAAKLGGAAA